MTNNDRNMAIGHLKCALMEIEEHQGKAFTSKARNSLKFYVEEALHLLTDDGMGWRQTVIGNLKKGEILAIITED